jgi:hypothetical protein
MTDLERYEPPPNLPAQQPAYRLSAWADDFLDTARVSSELARTRFVPKSLWVIRNRDGQEYFDAQATTAQVTAAIVTGRELGLEPMAALRSIDVIEGTPALRAVALRGILLAHGHDIWVEEASNHRATVAGRRANSDHEQRVTWTMDDAKSRNLAGKKNWRTQPRNMLIARATADVARLIAADALLGVPYIVEELEDQADTLTVDGTTVDAPAPTRRARRPRPEPAPAGPPADEPALDEAPPATPTPQTEIPPPAPVEATDEPPLDEEPATEPVENQEPPPPVDDEPTPGPAPITDRQMRLLHKLIRDKGLDRDSALTAISEVIERPIESTKDLNVVEAGRVIDWLQPEPDGAP